MNVMMMPVTMSVFMPMLMFMLVSMFTLSSVDIFHNLNI